MTLLLDTHAFVWWVGSDPRLSTTAREAIANETSAILVSVATAWEIAIKVGQGRWPEAASLIARFEDVLVQESFEALPIAISTVRMAGLMQSPHKDPFDRLIVAQAIEQGLTIVSKDWQLELLGAKILC